MKKDLAHANLIVRNDISFSSPLNYFNESRSIMFSEDLPFELFRVSFPTFSIFHAFITFIED